MTRVDYVLSNEDCKKLFLPSLIHANELKDCSMVLYEQGHYPVAYSLYILSWEEVSKAIMCSYGAMGISKVKKSDLTSHSVKQRFLIISLMVGVLLKWESIGEEFDKRIKDPNMKPISDDELPVELSNEITEVIEFLLSAEELKEAGFYVDIDGTGSIISPSEEITKESFPSFFLEPGGPFTLNENVIKNITNLNKYLEFLMKPEVMNKIVPKTIKQQLSETMTSSSNTTKTIEISNIDNDE